VTAIFDVVLFPDIWIPMVPVHRAGESQRTRWRDGRAWVWLGVRKQTGRGEGSSGLSFDRIVDLPN